MSRSQFSGQSNDQSYYKVTEEDIYLSEEDFESSHPQKKLKVQLGEKQSELNSQKWSLNHNQTHYFDVQDQQQQIHNYQQIHHPQSHHDSSTSLQMEAEEWKQLDQGKRIKEKTKKRKEDIAKKRGQNESHERLSQEQLKENRKKEQMQKNRISAQRSRDKAKEELKQMQDTIENLNQENQRLKDQINKQHCKVCNTQLTSEQSNSNSNQHAGSHSENPFSSTSEGSISEEPQMRFENFKYNFDQKDENLNELFINESAGQEEQEGYQRVRRDSGLFSPLFGKGGRNFSFMMLVIYLLAISIDGTGAGTNKLLDKSNHSVFVQTYEKHIQNSMSTAFSEKPFTSFNAAHLNLNNFDPGQQNQSRGNQNDNLNDKTQQQSQCIVSEEEKFFNCFNPSKNYTPSIPGKENNDLLKQFELNYNANSLVPQYQQKGQQQQEQKNNDQQKLQPAAHLRRLFPPSTLITTNTEVDDDNEIILEGSKVYCPYAMKFDYNNDLDLVEGKPLKQLKLFIDKKGLLEYRLLDDGNYEKSVQQMNNLPNRMYEINCLVTEIKEVEAPGCNMQPHQA